MTSVASNCTMEATRTMVRDDHNYGTDHRPASRQDKRRAWYNSEWAMDTILAAMAIGALTGLGLVYRNLLVALT